MAQLPGKWQRWEITDGKPVLVEEEWKVDGEFHHLTGPAWQRWDIRDGQRILMEEMWYVKGIRIDPEELRSPVRRIEHWWLIQRARRLAAVEKLLLQGGMTVWPGLMGLLEGY